MDDELYTIVAKVGTTMDDFLNRKPIRAYADMETDPFLTLLSFASDTFGENSSSVITLSETPRTVTKSVPTFLDSLGLFIEVLQEGKASPWVPNTNWRPRDRTVYAGTLYPGAMISNQTLGTISGYTGSFFSDVPVDLFEKDGEFYITPDLFFAFVRRFKARARQSSSADDFTMEKYVTLHDSYGHSWPLGPSLFRHKIRLINVGTDLLEYQANCWSIPYWGSPGWISGSEFEYTVKVVRAKVRQSLTVTISKSDGWYVSPPNVRHFSQGEYVPSGEVTQATRVGFRDGRDAIISVRSRSPFSIASCAPGLFHTQSQALRNYLGNCSRNFETLMESPGFLPVLTDVLIDTPKGLSKAITKTLPFLERLRLAIRLVSGLALAVQFAVTPTLKSAADAYDAFLHKVSEVEGEASLVFQGDAESYASLPAGLRSMCDSFVGFPVARYELVFRTQLAISPSRETVCSLVSDMAVQMARFGVTPDPVYLWAMLPFTFLIDAEFIPVGTLLRDVQSRLQLLSRRSTTVGHSVSINLTSIYGTEYKHYLRSNPTGVYIDPPRDSWLQSHGLSSSIRVPLLLLQLL